MAESIVSGATVQARYGREVKTLGHAWREFRRKQSPWVIASAIVGLAIVRALVGDFSWRDGVAVAAMLVITRSASGRSTSISCTRGRSCCAGGGSTSPARRRTASTTRRPTTSG